MTQKKKSRKRQSSRQDTVLNIVHVGDARTVIRDIPDNLVNLTVTSPPYFDLKDYGMPSQIGYGQRYDDYLDDVAAVFAETYRVTRQDGSLWIIIDTFRKGQEVLTLPFDLAGRLKPIGWILRDIIIWKKERTLPWTHAGSTRKIFEYILVFSKGTNFFRYDHDKYRDTSDLKKWWVRYPERYNPKGKSLEEIWSYDIPTQGSWGDKYIRHFCPLPSELVSRIIQLTTEKGDVVLDPFAGSGTVPTVSHLLERAFIGIELNPAYVQMFENHFKQQTKKKTQKSLQFNRPASDKSFEQTIEDLRIVKFGRLLLRELLKAGLATKVQVYVFKQDVAPTERFKHYCAEYMIMLEDSQLNEKARHLLEGLCSRPPLSKFGIQATLKFVNSKRQVGAPKKTLVYYRYTSSNSHIHAGYANFTESWDGTGQLFSPIALEVEEPNE